MSELNDYLMEKLQNEEFQKEYMKEILSEYTKTGNFGAFFQSLELVKKSRKYIPKNIKD